MAPGRKVSPCRREDIPVVELCPCRGTRQVVARALDRPRTPCGKVSRGRPFLDRRHHAFSAQQMGISGGIRSEISCHLAGKAAVRGLVPQVLGTWLSVDQYALFLCPFVATVTTPVVETVFFLIYHDRHLLDIDACSVRPVSCHCPHDIRGNVLLWVTTGSAHQPLPQQGNPEPSMAAGAGPDPISDGGERD